VGAGFEAQAMQLLAGDLKTNHAWGQPQRGAGCAGGNPCRRRARLMLNLVTLGELEEVLSSGDQEIRR
jgi:hypothetical protein